MAYLTVAEYEDILDLPLSSAAIHLRAGDWIVLGSMRLTPPARLTVRWAEVELQRILLSDAINQQFQVTGSTTAGSPTIPLANTSGLTPGMSVIATTIPQQRTILTVDGAFQITLNSGTGVQTGTDLPILFTGGETALPPHETTGGTGTLGYLGMFFRDCNGNGFDPQVDPAFQSASVIGQVIGFGTGQTANDNLAIVYRRSEIGPDVLENEGVYSWVLVNTCDRDLVVSSTGNVRLELNPQ